MKSPNGKVKKVNDSIPKVNSSSLSLSNTMGYSGSKVLATVGKGTLQIGDLENSDDFDRLNRETTALNKQLYQGSIRSSVDATLDHRFFSEDGPGKGGVKYCSSLSGDSLGHIGS